jgi:hypothetical protein
MRLLIFLRLLPGVALSIFVHLVREPWEFFKLLLEACRKECGKKPQGCVPLPRDVLRKPDPLIYSQGYLASLGLAVVWDNPDITLLHGGQPADAHALDPDTDYTVAIRVHNGSNQAPAFGVSVSLSYHLWGSSGPWIPVGQTQVDLPARGAPGEPATVQLNWHTPARDGHWCLDVQLQHPEDLNPLNNLGQTNVDIRRVKPGEALAIEVPVRANQRQTLRLRATGYSLPAEALYPPAPEGAVERYEKAVAGLDKQPLLADWIAASHSTGQPSVDNWTAYRSAAVPGRRAGKNNPQYGEDWLPRIVAANDAEAHSIPPEWEPALSADEVVVDAGAEVIVQLRLRVPPGAQAGTQKQFQVNAFDQQGKLAGGVEVLVVVI